MRFRLRKKVKGLTVPTVGNADVSYTRDCCQRSLNLVVLPQAACVDSWLTLAFGFSHPPQRITTTSHPQQTNKQINYGESLKVVGNQKQLGEWDAGRALPLKWSEGDVWTATTELPVGVDVEFKVGVSVGVLAVLTDRIA